MFFQKQRKHLQIQYNMSETIIKVENVSKQYRLGEIGTGSISHDLNRWWHQVRGKEDPYIRIGEENDRTLSRTGDYVWSLKDINFEIGKGELWGIIGKNGAGKSTLLKLLSRVTAPTTGTIKYKGKMASLLEVGTGFHQELTGRENIFLNGSILGMRKKEIQNKLDEIIDFAGVEKYIDTPVKRYSSGMTVRLAFAVAAHLDADILILDEVLAVGDAEFQNKALGKMQSLGKEAGKTVLFVSHNMAAIENLCNRGLVLVNGKIGYQGDISDAIRYYLNTNNANSLVGELNFDNRKRISDIQITHFEIISDNNIVRAGEKATFRVTFSTKEQISLDKLRLDIAITDDFGTALCWFSTHITQTDILSKTASGSFYIDFIIPNLPFLSGTYGLTFFCTYFNRLVDFIPDATKFTVEEGDFYKTGKSMLNGYGKIMIEHSFLINSNDQQHNK